MIILKSLDYLETSVNGYVTLCFKEAVTGDKAAFSLSICVWWLNYGSFNCVKIVYLHPDDTEIMYRHWEILYKTFYYSFIFLYKCKYSMD